MYLGSTMHARITISTLALLIWAASPLMAQREGINAQPLDSLKLFQDQPAKVFELERFVGYDTYGALYGITQNTLFKSAENGEFEFQELMLGPISSVDIQNPLTVLIFYRETNTVVFLDNRLNEKRRIDFNQIDAFPTIQWVFNAGSNRLWLMDQNSQTLWVYDTQNNRPLFQSQPITDLINLKCRFNDCMAQTPGELIQISLYGTFLKRQPIQEGRLVDYNDKHQLIQLNNAIFDLQSKQRLIFPEIQPENQINGLQLREDFLYIYVNKVVRRFALNP